MPVYIVKVPTSPPTERLVDAPNQASARNHVARSMLIVEVAKGADLFRLAKGGTELETAGPAPVPPDENIGSHEPAGEPGDPDPPEDDAPPETGKRGK